MIDVESDETMFNFAEPEDQPKQDDGTVAESTEALERTARMYKGASNPELDLNLKIGNKAVMDKGPYFQKAAIKASTLMARMRHGADVDPERLKQVTMQEKNAAPYTLERNLSSADERTVRQFKMFLLVEYEDFQKDWQERETKIISEYNDLRSLTNASNPELLPPFELLRGRSEKEQLDLQKQLERRMAGTALTDKQAQAVILMLTEYLNALKSVEDLENQVKEMQETVDLFDASQSSRQHAA